MAVILDVIQSLLNRKANGWFPTPYKMGSKFSNCSKFSLRSKQKQKGEKQ